MKKLPEWVKSLANELDEEAFFDKRERERDLEKEGYMIPDNSGNSQEDEELETEDWERKYEDYLDSQYPSEIHDNYSDNNDSYYERTNIPKRQQATAFDDEYDYDEEKTNTLQRLMVKVAEEYDDYDEEDKKIARRLIARINENYNDYYENDEAVKTIAKNIVARIIEEYKNEEKQVDIVSKHR